MYSAKITISRKCRCSFASKVKNVVYTSRRATCLVFFVLTLACSRVGYFLLSSLIGRQKPASSISLVDIVILGSEPKKRQISHWKTNILLITSERQKEASLSIVLVLTSRNIVVYMRRVYKDCICSVMAWHTSLRMHASHVQSKRLSGLADRHRTARELFWCHPHSTHNKRTEKPKTPHKFLTGSIEQHGANRPKQRRTPH